MVRSSKLPRVVACLSLALSLGLACEPPAGPPDTGSGGAGDDGAPPDAGDGATTDAPPDAGSDGAVESGAADGASDGGADADAGALDAATDAPFEAQADAAVDSPTSQFCGDGIRDPLTEECDDGTGTNPPDSCSSACVVQDVLLAPAATLPSTAVRRLGEGRHPIAAGNWGFAVAFVETAGAPVLGARLFDGAGVPGATVPIANDATTLPDANPVIAAMPTGVAVAWTDFGGDGNSRGVALRTLDAVTGAAGPKVRVNATTLFNQRDVDLVWTGSALVAAWLDDSKIVSNGYDLKVRTFTAQGVPKGAEAALADSAAHESHVALATDGNGSWAAAWRSTTAGGEVIAARAGSATFSIPVSAPGPAGDRPALVGLGGGSWLVVFTEGGGAFAAPRLRAALLQPGSPSPTPFDLPPLLEPWASDASLGQSQPSAARLGTRVFVAWRSGAIAGNAGAEELWLKEIGVSAAAGGITFDLSKPEIALPRQDDHRKDDQRAPALAGGPLLAGGALTSAWDDFGRTFGAAQGKPDVVAELIPVPILRLPAAPDGGGQ